MSYGKVHQFLARTMASRGSMSIPEVRTALFKFSGDQDVSIEDMVQEINKQIRPLKYEIKITTDELTDVETLVYVSLGFDHATKAQNLFTANELEFFRLLIEEIMKSDTRQLNGFSAINIIGGMTSTFKKTDAEKLLKTLCRMKFLDLENNTYALGVRAINEFESYICQNLPDTIKECHLCKKIVFRGYNCPACAQAIHTRCLNRYVEKIEKWPCCKTNYSADQIEQMNADSSRLTQTQPTEVTQSPEEDNSEGEATVMEATEDIDVTQLGVAGPSRKTLRGRGNVSSTRNYKRSRLTQTQPTEVTQSPEEENSEGEATVMEATEDIVTQLGVAGPSRSQGTRSSRKRKRQPD